MDSTIEAQQFGQLRSRIEATFSDSTLLVITSAARGDGKSVTAFGLAGSLADAGHRVLFVDANADAPTLTRSAHRPITVARIERGQVCGYATPVAGQRFLGISFADEKLEAGLSMPKVRLAVADMLSEFDFTIVDTAQLIRSNLAVLFATVAHGTLLTLRSGRLSTLGDDETIGTLSRVGANPLGALLVAPKMIKNFRGRAELAAGAVLLPARHVTTRYTTAAPEPVREVEVTEVTSRTTFVS